MQTVRLSLNLPDISSLSDAKTPLEALQWGMMQGAMCLQNADVDTAKVDEAIMLLNLSTKFATHLSREAGI